MSSVVLESPVASRRATMFGATVYMLVRPFLPGRGAARVAASAAGFGLTLAALTVEPEGSDFSQLQPLALWTLVSDTAEILG